MCNQRLEVLLALFPTSSDVGLPDSSGLDLDIHRRPKFVGLGKVLYPDICHRADPDPLKVDWRADVQPLDGAVEVQHKRPRLGKKLAPTENQEPNDDERHRSDDKRSDHRRIRPSSHASISLLPAPVLPASACPSQRGLRNLGGSALTAQFPAG